VLARVAGFNAITGGKFMALRNQIIIHMLAAS
jgi:hypothetical protein